MLKVFLRPLIGRSYPLALWLVNLRAVVERGSARGARVGCGAEWEAASSAPSPFPTTSLASSGGPCDYFWKESWHSIYSVIDYKVNRCLARYSPRATTTNRLTNRAPNKPAWPGPNWPKMPILGQIWSFLGKKSFFLQEKSKVLLPKIRKPT